MSDKNTSTTSLLDPVLVAQLGSLELRARKILDSAFSGRYIRRLRGTSQEFSEHKPYNLGDDPKLLDWKIFARTDRLVTRTYQDESNIVGMFVLDTSASMTVTFGDRLSKLDYAKTSIAALAQLFINQNDGAGFMTQETECPSIYGQGSLPHFFQQLDSVRSGGEFNWSDILKKQGHLLKRRQMVILFSDLMADEQKIQQVIHALQASRHEVLVFQILDPSELTLPYQGLIQFQDSETTQMIETDASVIRAAYEKWVREHLDRTAQFFKKNGIEYSMLLTTTPFEEGLGAYLSWRQSLV